MREYDTERKRTWRIKVKQGKEVSGKIEVNNTDKLYPKQ